MSKATIYHNPRCSKSRQTLELIRATGQEPDIVLYLENPPAATTLQSLFAAMGKKPVECMRTKEPLFAELGLSKFDQRSDQEWLAIIEKHPKLMERPIVVKDNRVAMGRPPENVLDIL